MAASNLQELIEAAAKQEQERLATQIVEAQQKLITVSYDKAATYTTVIIFGGYAGMFALWQLTKDFLSKPQALWAALLVLISLVSFVLFEVGKMILVTRSVFAKARVLNSPRVKSDPHYLLQALQDLENTQHATLLPFMIGWAISVGVCIITALGAVGVLGYAFIVGLAK